MIDILLGFIALFLLMVVAGQHFKLQDMDTEIDSLNRRLDEGGIW